MRAWVAALLLVTACGTVSVGGLPLPSPPTAALDRWNDFPVHAKPRPIIAFGVTVEHIQAKGFPDADRKVAWFCSKFVFADGAQPSSAVPGTVTAGGVAYPAISSAEAYRDLMVRRADGKTGCRGGLAPFVISSVRLAKVGFPTDRGTLEMSAWLFDVPEVNGYLGHTAVALSAFWGGGVSPEGRGARITPDGMTLKVPVSNAEPGPCGSDYTAAAAESGVAVAVAVKQIPHASSGTAVACPAVLRVGYIQVKLKAPLGDRVLVDEQGKPGTVCPEAGDC